MKNKSLDKNNEKWLNDPLKFPEATELGLQNREKINSKKEQKNGDTKKETDTNQE